jgi:hypothetical protein
MKIHCMQGRRRAGLYAHMWAIGWPLRPLAVALLATALAPLVAGQAGLPTAADSTLAQIRAGAAQLQRQALWLAAATSTVLPLGAIEAGTAKAAGTALYRGYQVWCLKLFLS